ncbi:MAG: gliding motility-associated C-terminal domain-containing protein [Bacteroidota bacterium]|nr:gliding motility-associated C-terminal domain-containing protein [Bacteroidota bacterium]
MRKFISLLFFTVAVSCLTIHAESINVTSGGSNKPIRIQTSDPLSFVYVCYNLDDVTMTFSDETTSPQWYKYSSGKDPVLIPGSTSYTLKKTESERGYSLSYNDKTYWVWLIDYQDYKDSLRLNKSIYLGANPISSCDQLVLNSKGLDRKYSIPYYAPSVSNAKYYDVNWALSYKSMTFDPISKAYIPMDTVITLTYGDNLKTGGGIYLFDDELPLMNTNFGVADQFAYDWKLGNAAESPDIYLAKRVKVTVIHEHNPLRNESNNMVRGEDASSTTGTAPFDITFTAYANKPVATYFSWSILDSLDNKITASSDESLRYTFNSGKYKVNLSVVNAKDSCESTYSESIDVSESGLKVPNAFSPNGDGINDEFKVSYKSLSSFKGWIFNRWGVQLFYWTDPSKGWNGKVNGNYVSTGAYFYVIEATGSDGHKYKEKGAVNVFSNK